LALGDGDCFAFGSDRHGTADSLLLRKVLLLFPADEFHRNTSGHVDSLSFDGGFSDTVPRTLII